MRLLLKQQRAGGKAAKDRVGRGQQLVEFPLRVRQRSDSPEDLFSSEFRLGIVGRTLPLVFHDRLNVIAAEIFVDFGNAGPRAERNTAIASRLPSGVVSAARQVGSVIVCSFVW